jgi:hypothetical protein
MSKNLNITNLVGGVSYTEFQHNMRNGYGIHSKEHLWPDVKTVLFLWINVAECQVYKQHIQFK